MFERTGPELVSSAGEGMFSCPQREGAGFTEVVAFQFLSRNKTRESDYY